MKLNRADEHKREEKKLGHFTVTSTKRKIREVRTEDEAWRGMAGLAWARRGRAGRGRAGLRRGTAGTPGKSGARWGRKFA
ncbi:hypothetical protein E2C01_038018 [Portunus trituberculatus]|uniref:Uncharacterized protein n=1 Tax=Portunus trituberculatus TaxID=210409 RepID=A0A5B7FFN0_PORTR|nr:hypothetical protein [Portunus trituberculatus]